MHQHGVVAAPVNGARGPLGALLLYCDPGQSGLRGRYLAFARAYAAHAGALLEASAERLATMQATANALIQMLAAHDAATARHSHVVRRLARALGVALGLSPRGLLDLEYSALLHDVGKVAVPVDMLQRYGPLSAPEWAVMRQHPAVGERIVRSAAQLAPAAQAVRHHHERWDGGGYPDRLAGPAIPLHARLVSLADAYEAISVGRPYREARTPEEAVRELRHSAGSQFDPDHLCLLPALSGVDFSV
jgi:HD-GYP domain-containing protein (c-di-GMP phosphodiesterase class II)